MYTQRFKPKEYRPMQAKKEEKSLAEQVQHNDIKRDAVKAELGVASSINYLAKSDHGVPYHQT